MRTKSKNKQDRTRRRDRKNAERLNVTKLVKTIFHYKSKYRISTKKWILYKPRFWWGGGNSPSAAKFSFARHGPCLRKDPALRCPRRFSLDSSKWVRSVPRRNSRNPTRTGSEPPPNIQPQKTSKKKPKINFDLIL